MPKLQEDALYYLESVESRYVSGFLATASLSSELITSTEINSTK